MVSLDAITLTVALVLAFVGGGAAVWYVSRRLFSRKSFQERIVTQHITERVRAVGRLVGLEVYAKEIATATTGLGWLPPLLLSQARLAMIFHFQKQYFVDLARLGPGDVEDLGDSRFRITLPPIEGTLRLTDVTPYDIQSGRVMGLVDIIPMNADRQRDLMKKAQQQAAELYEHSDGRYRAEARASIERHVQTLLEMFGVRAEIGWSNAPTREPALAPIPADASKAFPRPA